jgi:hypothetical protein
MAFPMPTQRRPISSGVALLLVSVEQALSPHQHGQSNDNGEQRGEYGNKNDTAFASSYLFGPLAARRSRSDPSISAVSVRM